jgi:uncharacterized protein YjbJ (UPF0337 family)
MDTEKAEGVLEEVAVKVQGATGALVGDSAAQLAAKAKELSGKVLQLRADAASAVRVPACPGATIGKLIPHGRLC